MNYRQWPAGLPPAEWPRLLAVDPGGSSPWGFLWSAVDPQDNLVCYDELYRTTASVDLLLVDALPKMKHPDGTEYQWKAKIIDYENKIAAHDLQRGGITMTNAQKHDKAASIERLKGYMHCNPKHHYPEWHPKAGLPGSPRLFVMARCKNLRREIPQAIWLESGGVVKNEMDRRTGNHQIDNILYQIRELPPPLQLKPAPPAFGAKTNNRSKISEMYWFDSKTADEAKERDGWQRPGRNRAFFSAR